LSVGRCSSVVAHHLFTGAWTPGVRLVSYTATDRARKARRKTKSGGDFGDRSFPGTQDIWLGWVLAEPALRLALPRLPRSLLPQSHPKVCTAPPLPHSSASRKRWPFRHWVVAGCSALPWGILPEVGSALVSPSRRQLPSVTADPQSSVARSSRHRNWGEWHVIAFPILPSSISAYRDSQCGPGSPGRGTPAMLHRGGSQPRRLVCSR
jgi:hypothetical protein